MDKKKTVDEAKTIIKRAERKKPELIKIKTEIAQVVAVSRVTARETKQTKTNVTKNFLKKKWRSSELIYTKQLKEMKL